MSQPHHDPNWPRASAWLEGATLEPTVGKLGILGVPLNRSITPGRCDLAPKAIRDAMFRLSTYDLRHERDIRQVSARDYGDADVSELSPEEALAPIRSAMGRALGESDALVLLGGDNGITRPGVLGFGLPLERVGVVTLDAHLDLRDTKDGLMNGNPIRALLDDGLPGKNVVQIGIQDFANSAAYHRVAKDAGICIVSMQEAVAQGIGKAVGAAFEQLAERVDAIYFDLDIDVLDRAFSPATPGARPGGLTPTQLFEAAYEAGKHPKVKVMDLVEIDPTKDINDVTCLTAATCILHFASGLMERHR
ncbi:MAG: agmatinase family protein [Fimbriimonadaceae bacterium]|nr:agmatinase family protein [Fimbriimonadaceae bacterium]